MGPHRPDADLQRGLAAWAASRWPGEDNTIGELKRPDSGWANETILVTVGPRRLVVRLPQAMPLYPEYPLAAQAKVMAAVARGGVPVPEVVALELNDEWLGEPFLVMARVEGRPGPEAPVLDRDLAERAPALQARMQHGMFDQLPAIHRIDWESEGLEDFLLRGDLVAWSRYYIDWATDGRPPTALAEAIDFCAQHEPAHRREVLCWGDVRLGNVLFDDEYRVTAVLDWELATIGPPESDLAWYLVLDDLLEAFTQRRVPGFDLEGPLVDRYEQAAGQPVENLEWHKIFALTRSVALSERLALLAAETGLPYPGIAGDGNPVLHQLTKRIQIFER
ncbi:MAG TPA: phosphotransferase family protein [Acidimicrobiales bacterium]|nr:phosphotransferase family protein [Acidimicrobiales bacterium]